MKKLEHATMKMRIRDLRALASLMNTAVVNQNVTSIIDCLDKIEAITMSIRTQIEE